LKQENRHGKFKMREVQETEREDEKMREIQEFDTHRWSVKRDARTRERSGREEKGKEKKNENFPSFSPFLPCDSLMDEKSILHLLNII
jgi:hypothetical protein